MEDKTREKIINELLHKIMAFTETPLFTGNAERIYYYLKSFNYDKGSWHLYSAAQDILHTTANAEFPTENNMGYFESLDGNELLKWIEVAKFAEKEYKFIPGGIERTIVHTFDKDLPEYQAYRATLFSAAVMRMIGDLQQNQPNLLADFMTRLLDVETIIKNGLPMINDLHEKLKVESISLVKNAKKENIEGKLPEYEAKLAIYNALFDVHISDMVIPFLLQTENVLDSIYRVYDESKDNQIYTVVNDYLEKVEYDFKADKLFNRVVSEYKDFICRVKELPPKKIIEKAYELTFLYDIVCCLNPKQNIILSNERINSLMSVDKPLRSLYIEWLDRGYDYAGDLVNMIKKTVGESASEVEENDNEIYTTSLDHQIFYGDVDCEPEL